MQIASHLCDSDLHQITGSQSAGPPKSVPGLATMRTGDLCN